MSCRWRPSYSFISIYIDSSWTVLEHHSSTCTLIYGYVVVHMYRNILADGLLSRGERCAGVWTSGLDHHTPLRLPGQREPCQFSCNVCVCVCICVLLYMRVCMCQVLTALPLRLMECHLYVHTHTLTPISHQMCVHAWLSLNYEVHVQAHYIVFTCIHLSLSLPPSLSLPLSLSL